METPVIIAARNEEKHIGKTLKALAKQKDDIEPIVVINGCIDKTADIASLAGATVLDSPEGKMPAIQKAFRYLGKRALEPVLILDADSRPMFKNWSRRLTSEASNLPLENPAIAWGPYVFWDDINPVAGTFFTATAMQVSWSDRDKEQPRTVKGGNTALRIQNEDVLEEMLAMENYWPREDVAIYDTVMSSGGNKKVTLHPETWVITSGSRLSEALKRIFKERSLAGANYDDSYAAEAPPSSTPYNSPGR